MFPEVPKNLNLMIFIFRPSWYLGNPRELLSLRRITIVIQHYFILSYAEWSEPSQNIRIRISEHRVQHTQPQLSSLLRKSVIDNVRKKNNVWGRKAKTLEFENPYSKISRNDTIIMQNTIMSFNLQKRKELGINKSTHWYQQKKIKEEKEIKGYKKTRVKMDWIIK